VNTTHDHGLDRLAQDIRIIAYKDGICGSTVLLA